jgi:hypothetical protein
VIIVLRQFEKDLNDGDELLAPLFMLTGGGPPRWTEMARCRWTNGQSHMRNFYQIFGMLAMITMYNKSEVMGHAPRVVVRFYPSRVGRVALAMISEVLPFWTLLQVSVGEKPDLTHQWWQRGSGRMHRGGISTALKKATKQYLGTELGVRDLRHVLIGIDRELIRQPLADAQDATERGAYEAQTGHSEQTETLNYAIALADLCHTNQKTLRAYFGTSTRSHTLFGIGDSFEAALPTALAAKKSKGGAVKIEDGVGEVKVLVESLTAQVDRLSVIGQELTASKESTPTLQASSTHSQDQPQVVGPPRILELLRQLYGATAKFRPGQLLACQKMLNEPDDLFVQLPTGGGKTLLVEISALSDGDKMSVVFVPYTALREDLGRRLRAAGVDARIFASAHMGHVNVVLVTPERAAEQDFCRFWEDACVRGRVSRVFWDECHLIEMEATKKDGSMYRPYQQVLDYCAKPLLDGVRPPQRVFMSATLPGHIMEAVQARAEATKANMVRTSTSRPTLQWGVRTVAVDTMQAELVKIVQAAQPGKAIIYVMSVQDGEHLASTTGWPFYHGKSGAEGRQYMERFSMLESSNVLIATTAAGSGWDVDVQLVVLYQGAFDAVTATQQGGRAGRTPGTVGTCVTLLASNRQPRASREPGTVAWETFLATNGCRRVALETYIDHVWRPPCREEEQKCDRCWLGVQPEPRPIPPQAVLEMDPHWSFDDWTNLSPDLLGGEDAGEHTGASWAFQNSLHAEESGSSELPGPADTELLSSPPTRVRKLQELCEAEDVMHVKRVKPDSILVPCTPLSQRDYTATPTFSMPPMPGGFEIPAPAQMVNQQTAQNMAIEHETQRLLAGPPLAQSLPGTSYNAPITLDAGTMVPASNAVEEASRLLLDNADRVREIWDQTLCCEREGAVLAASDRVIAALITMQAERAACVYCWWLRAAPWDGHQWGDCARRQAKMPVWDTKKLTGLKIRMKKVLRLPETVCEVSRLIHVNCFAPIGRGSSLHPPGNWNFKDDCLNTQRMVMVVLMGLREKRHGGQIGNRFRLALTLGEDEMARRLIRSVGDTGVTMVVWDAFLFCCSYRSCLGRAMEE